AARATQVVDGLSEGVDALLKQMAEQVAYTQANIRAIEDVSLRAIDGMNQGAMTMGTAAQRFETAGSAVTTVFDRSTKVSEQLTATANTLQTAAAAVRDGFQQYDTTRQTVDKNVALLTGLVEQAKRETGMTKELITDLERVAHQIRAAEH